ncbi:MAG: hydrogen gas-evolving membrane-bound hydrogenase subunit E [Alphaproteobacteria bacterium]
MIRPAANALAVALLGVVLAGLVAGHSEPETLRSLAKTYITMAPQELATPNVVTAILLNYRAFDTLGEVAVLFMVAAGIGLVLGGRGEPRDALPAREPEPTVASSEIVRSGAALLFPLISIFAAYIIMNGHLSAGGGFQGGAVLASGVMLLLLARPGYPLDVGFLSTTESLAGVLLVVTGLAGLIFAGGFLDSRVLPLGQFGSFFSAGAIPVLSVLLGIKVGCELSVIIDQFRR